MTPCTTPRCQSPARWRVTGTDRVVCGDHIPDSTPVEAIPDDTILAARCPAGWRRDPGTGRPVMPCLGRLLFPCAPEEVPTHLEVRRQLHELFNYTDSIKPCWVNLIGAILGDARSAKVCDGPGLSQDTEKYLSDCIDEVLRFRGTVRLRRVAGGWEEVGGVSTQQRIIESLSSGWHWTDESLPGIDGRLLISVGGSCREGFYKDGKFSDKYGEQKPEAWMSLPMAPSYRNGQYVGH